MTKYYTDRCKRAKTKLPVKVEPYKPPLDFVVHHGNIGLIKDMFEQADEIMNVKRAKQQEEPQRDYTPSQILWKSHDSVRDIFGPYKSQSCKEAEKIEKSQELFPPSQEGAEPEGHECVVIDLVGTPDIIGASYPEVNLCIDTSS